MKYKFLYIFVIVLIGFFAYYSYFSNRHSFPVKEVEIDYMVANKTWDTSFTDKVFYKKGDNIEYVYVIKNKSDKAKTIKVNTGTVAKDFGILSPYVELQSTVLSGQDATILKISGVSNVGGNTNDQIKKINDIISFEDVKISANHDSSSSTNVETSQPSNSVNGNNIEIKPASNIGSNTESGTQLAVSSDVELSQVGGSDIVSVPSSTSSNLNNSAVSTGNNGISSIVTSTGINDSQSQTTGSSQSGSNSNTNNNSSVPLAKSYTFSSDMDNLVKINTGNLNVKSVGIGEKFFNVMVVSNELYVYIPKKTFASGKYFFTYILNNGDMIASSDSFNFTLDNKPVNIITLVPNKIPNNTDRWITVQGLGLKKTVSVQLSNNTIFKKTDFQIVSDSVLAVKIPAEITAGTYFLNIMTLDGIYEFPTKTFDIYFKSKQ